MNNSARSLATILAIPLLLAGCAADDVPDVPTEPLTWGPCPDDSVQLPGGPAIAPWADGECNRREVPLLWEDDGAETIEVFTARFPSLLDGPGRGRIVALTGGPGGTGAEFSPRVSPSFDRYRELGWSLVVPTPRGAGESTPIDCPNPPSPLADDELALTQLRECGEHLREEWGRLDAFAVQQAARDVCDLLERENETQSTVLLGASYGVLWVQHVLHICPERVDAVAFDGVSPIDGDEGALPQLQNETGMSMVDECAATPGCAQHFGGDPHGVIASVFESARAGTLCPAATGGQLGAKQVRQLLATLLGRELSLVMPTVARLNRCSDEDAAALRRLLGLATGPGEGDVALFFNTVLSHTVYFQESCPRILSEAPEEESLFFDSGLGAFARAGCEVWPRYEDYSVWTEYRGTEIPTVTFNGRYDLATPIGWAEQLVDNYPDSSHTFVELPLSAHGTLFLTDEEGGACIHDIFGQFLANPAAPLDISCVSSMPSPDLAAESARARMLAQLAFGEASPWGEP